MAAADSRKQGAPQNLGRAKLTWIKHVGVHRGLSHFDAHLAIVLMGYVNNETGETFVSQGKLAEKLGAIVRGVQKALDALVEAGYLKKLREGHGPKTPNLYTLTLPRTSDRGPAKATTKGQTDAIHTEQTDFTKEDPEYPF
jgi:biotin operon repressor